MFRWVRKGRGPRVGETERGVSRNEWGRQRVTSRERGEQGLVGRVVIIWGVVDGVCVTR